jgi:hypothetical protein
MKMHLQPNRICIYQRQRWVQQHMPEALENLNFAQYRDQKRYAVFFWMDELLHWATTHPPEGIKERRRAWQPAQTMPR